ncbi:glycosyltransferase family 39 protein [Variovorax sp. J22R133]|uniref:glycosyltransferase family 39 protein n=1 Tax=Variovorax brevis TaxID=3053503 RepID=UPI002576E90B|nr:glycosyltransferase family 39 protein [Variovorax sp. J22R133]MDM0112296.1 glycosyltransferase family 39 protein [Variovorax sp. J22R133]
MDNASTPAVLRRFVRQSLATFFSTLQKRLTAVQNLSAGQVFAIATLSHVLLWTLLPTLFLKNASLDMVEALAWGHEWQLGYEKDPPLWPWITEAITAWSGKGLWPAYLAAQLCVGTVFLATWHLGRRVTSNREALVGVLLLEGIFYFNYPTPEFNDIVLQMPFAAIFGWLLHRALTANRLVDWCLSGLFAGLGLWSRYSMGAYIAPVVVFVLLHPLARRRLAQPGPWLMLLTAFLVFLPHMHWILRSDFISIIYVGGRAPAVGASAEYLARLLPFAKAQLAAFIPMLALTAMLFRWRSAEPREQSDLRRFNQAYLAVLALGPMAFSIGLSVVTQRLPRVMWAAPLVCFAGLFAATTIRPVLTPERLRWFGRAWLVVLLLPAASFALIQLYRPTIVGDEGRTQFPGQQLASEVTSRWSAQTGKHLRYVIGDTWHAGNAAFYSADRPSVLFAHCGYRGNPWVTPEKLKESGAVLVWDAREVGVGIPPGLVAQFPEAVLQPKISLHQNVSTYEIGVALLFPDGTADK